MLKRVLIVLLICFSLISSCLAAPDSLGPKLSAQAAALIDLGSGRVLFESDADKPLPIASTTKIMTALVVLENCELDDVVKVSPLAVGAEGSSLYLKAGERLTVKDLLYGLMLRSGNDAALALAIHCAGSVEVFAHMMNERAAGLGLHNCLFANPNGLDDENHYCSALDLARITAEAMQNDDFKQIVSTKRYSVGQRSFKNHNKLLWNYEGAVGVKTGFTKKAGRTLVGAAENEGRTIITVTLNDPSDWSDHARLFDYGFKSFTARQYIMVDEIIARIPVIGADALSIPVKAEEFSYPLTEGEQLTKRILLPQYLFAPVTEGDVLGTIEFLMDDEVIKSVDLEAACSVEMSEDENNSLLGRIFRIFKKE